MLFILHLNHIFNKLLMNFIPIFTVNLNLIINQRMQIGIIIIDI